jgi:hypothetical protein
MVLIKTARYIFGNGKKYNISKIKTEQYDETYDLTSFMANPTTQMLIPTVARHIFQACPVWMYTQSNITSIIFT